MRTIAIHEYPTGAMQVELYLTRPETERLKWIAGYGETIAARLAASEFEQGQREYDEIESAVSDFMRELYRLLLSIPGPRSLNTAQTWRLGRVSGDQQQPQAPWEQAIDVPDLTWPSNTTQANTRAPVTDARSPRNR